MANALNIDLTGKVVILSQRFFRAGLNAADHPYRVDGGFGAVPFTAGTALTGQFLSDGERARVDALAVARLATEAEIAAVS